ncbi:hypothetical protein KM043_008476 [Ampulex compressa]|nr:hypothetical protein KM043_008476 [Ampulex compressa]
MQEHDRRRGSIKGTLRPSPSLLRHFARAEGAAEGCSNGAAIPEGSRRGEDERTVDETYVLPTARLFSEHREAPLNPKDLPWKRGGRKNGGARHESWSSFAIPWKKALATSPSRKHPPFRNDSQQRSLKLPGDPPVELVDRTEEPQDSSSITKKNRTVEGQGEPDRILGLSRVELQRSSDRRTPNLEDPLSIARRTSRRTSVHHKPNRNFKDPLSIVNRTETSKILSLS